MKADDPYQRVSQPLLIVISGPSGVGKDTIARLLMQQRDRFHFVVTATTRAARPGETHGRDYIFVTQDEFARMIDDGELLEYAVVYDDFKGVPKQQIRDALASGRDVIMRVDVQGAATIRKLVPDAIFVFLLAESESAMVERLKERRSETDESLKLRIATARQEMHRLKDFDYWVINADGRQDSAVSQILCIVDAEHQRVNRRPISI
jgi:guanylate kinase